MNERVQYRAHRQQSLLRRSAPGLLDVIVTEGALRLQVGSEAVMEAQLAHMRAVNDGKQVTVRILPARNGLHTAMRGPFSIPLFDDDADPDLIYLESVVGARYVERPDHVDAFKQAIEQMRAQALPLEEYIDQHHAMDQSFRQ